MKKNGTVKKYAKNSIWLIIQSIYNLILALTINSAAIRYLGPDNYGGIEYAKSIIAILNIVCVLGIDNIIINEALQHKDTENRIISNALLLRLITGFVAFFSVSIYSLCDKTQENTILFIQSVSLLFNGLSIFKEWFLLKLNSKIYVLICMLSSTISALYTVLILLFKAPVYMFVLVGIIESIALCFGFIINLRSKKDFRFIVTFDYTALILSKSIPFVFADLSIVLYNEIDKIMLKNMLGNHQVGIYSIARNVGMLWDFIPLAFIQSIRPLMLKAIHEVDKTKIQMLNSAITCITSIICLAANIALLLFGKVYIALIYQENYLESSNYLSIFGISVFFSMVGCIGSIWLLGKELERYSAYRTIAGAILNGILNYILIPQYGIMGAALATLVTQIFVSIIYLFIINRTRDIVVMIFKGYSYAAKNGKKIIDIIFECGK